MSGKCPTTGKIQYVSSKEAWRVIEKMGHRHRSERQKREGGTVTKAFRCPFCPSWHIGRTRSV